MNPLHLELCASAAWAETVRDYILPWTLGDHELGDDVLEVGPGPGMTTDILRVAVQTLTALEVDAALAGALRRRLAGTNVTVVQGDGSTMPFERERFSAVTCFTMLHHIPTAELQDRLLAEACRVLRPGGAFLGVDSVDSDAFRALHDDDTCVPVAPAGLAGRLAAAGFREIEVEEANGRFRFTASA